MEQGNPNRKIAFGTYGAAFGITALIFATALFASTYSTERRVADIRSVQDNISVDILSLETQFDLLAENSCGDIEENSVLSSELLPIAARLSTLESQSNVNTDELTRLKRYYSLLQIKDLLLMKQVSEKCGLEPIFLLYFYSNAGDCPECEEQGYVLTALNERYPQLRIYSFDYNLDLSALRTLTSISNVKPPLPAIVINGRLETGFKEIDDIEAFIPELAELKQATSTEDESDAN